MSTETIKLTPERRVLTDMDIEIEQRKSIAKRGDL